MKTDTRASYHERILRALVYMQEHLDEALSLDDLASVACFSPYHFHRVFHGMVGESVKQHVRRLRLERAAGRLRYTGQRVTMIAFDAGYETHEAFTRAFRTAFGVSPSEFRRRRRALRWPEAPAGVRYVPDGLPAGLEPVQRGGREMDVRVEQIAPIRVAFLRHVGPYEEAWKTWEALLRWAGDQGRLREGARLFGISHDDPELTPHDKLRHDACVEVDADFTPQGEIGVQTIAGGEYAIVTHEGPYESLGESYARLCGEWLPQSGREPRAAPPFEQMHNTPLDTAPQALRTDIYLPLVG